MTWLPLAVGLLYMMMDSILIYNSAETSVRYTIWGLIALPYRVTLKRSRIEKLPTTKQAPRPRNDSSEADKKRGKERATEPASSHNENFIPRGSHCVTVRIVMPSNFGFRSWRWYEALIETMSVGIYLYATFVLTSLLYLNADKAIQYATVMAMCLSIVRISTALF